MEKIFQKGNNLINPNSFQGIPNSLFPSQQVDHVRINYRGKAIGRDGNPLSPTSLNPSPTKTEEVHIPLSEWLKWSTWYKP